MTDLITEFPHLQPSLHRVWRVSTLKGSTMSQHQAILQLLSLGQESFEDEIWRLVSVQVYIFVVKFTSISYPIFKIRSKSQIFHVRVLAFNI